MAVIVEERGRGKFKPAPNYHPDEVKELLYKKIEEEKNKFAACSEPIDFSKLCYDEKKFNLLSLFSGCGGLDLGFELAGLKAIMGADVVEAAINDKTIFDANISNNVFNTIYVNDIFDEARETYERNAGRYIYMDKSDIRKIKEFPPADIVLGGFPCPGFSEAGPRLVDDERNFLYLHFIRCLMQSQPKIFVAENVKGMMTLGKGEVFKQIVQDFAAAGYTIYHKLLNAAEYGVPQVRERVILVGVRKDIDFEYHFPQPTHGYGVDGLEEVVTLRDAIGDLENEPGDYFTGSYSTIFMSRNRKKKWSEPSFTIQASGRQAPIHPGGAPMVHVGKDRYEFSDGEENNRRLSVKEIARIQTFPDWYEFSRGTKRGNENAKLDLVYKQIGNAVPVRLAMAVAMPIAEWVKGNITNMNACIVKEQEEHVLSRTGKKFSKEEKHVLELFDAGKTFEYAGKKYCVILSDKPTCKSGEPKTDIYVKAVNIIDSSDIIEIKISYKRENADFIENKMGAERAQQILGDEWKRIIIDKLEQIRPNIEKAPLIFFDKKGNTDPGSIALGWRFEIVDKKKGGKLSGDLELSKEQLIEAYRGANNTQDKRDAVVCGKVIPNSGVADYMVRINADKLHSAQDVIDHLIPIDEYVEMYPISTYVCKALNYWTKEMHQNKRWEGDRALSVYVEWSAIDGKLTPDVVVDRPLEQHGNQVAHRLQEYMKLLNITDTDDLTESNLGTDRVHRKNNKK